MVVGYTALAAGGRVRPRKPRRGRSGVVGSGSTGPGVMGWRLGTTSTLDGPGGGVIGVTVVG